MRKPVVPPPDAMGCDAPLVTAPIPAFKAVTKSEDTASADKITDVLRTRTIAAP